MNTWDDDTMCSECAVLQTQIKQLERRIQRQARLLKLAGRIIKKQRQQLDTVQVYTWSVICQAGRDMSQHLPRGTWSLWRGRLEVARKVFRIVWIDWSRTFLEMMGRISGL